MENTILNFFWNVVTSGIDLGVSFLSSCGFMLPYIIAAKETPKAALDSVLFLFLGRMFYFMFFGALAGFFGDIVPYLFYNSKWLYYVNILMGIVLVFWGFLLIVSGIKKYRILEFLYRWDHLFMFILGIMIGIIPNISSKIFFSDLILNTNSYILGLICGFIFGLASFISPLILLALILGYVFQKIYQYYPSFSSVIQKISGSLIIYLGIKYILEAWVIIRA